MERKFRVVRSSPVAPIVLSPHEQDKVRVVVNAYRALTYDQRREALRQMETP